MILDYYAGWKLKILKKSSVEQKCIHCTFLLKFCFLLYNCKRKYILKVERVICTFFGDLQQLKVAPIACKTKLSNSCTWTASQESDSAKYDPCHQNICRPLSLTLDYLFQKGFAVCQKVFRLRLFWSIRVTSEITENHPDYRSVWCTKGFIAFLSLKWFKGVRRYIVIMVSKTCTALGPVRMMKILKLVE